MWLDIGTQIIDFISLPETSDLYFFYEPLLSLEGRSRSDFPQTIQTKKKLLHQTIIDICKTRGAQTGYPHYYFFWSKLLNAFSV